MPARNGTGPMGQGPMTGRGLGPCRRSAGYGLGRGYGRGMGYGYRSADLRSLDTERTLQTQIENLERQLQDVQAKLDSLK